VKLGDYSYSIYLVHFPIIVLLNYLPFGGTRLAVEGYVKLIIAVILIILVSAILYIFVEKKFSAKLNIIKISAFIFITIFVSSFILSAFNLSQFNLRERNIFSAWTDRDTYRCGKIFRIFNPFDIICNIKDAGGGGGKSILLIGNSHADSIKKAFADKAFVYGASTFFVVANDPLLGGGPSAERIIEEVVKQNIKFMM
jgi:hypothetical protein